jgi:hypothetical protein
MANIWDTIDRLEGALRGSAQRSGRSVGAGDIVPKIGKLSFRPNAPRMVTIILAIALILVGLTVSGTLTIGFVNDLLAQANLDLTRDQGYLLLLGSPVLLILGSLLPGI